MPIVIYLKNGQQVVSRGERVGAWRRFLLILRLPMTVKALAVDDVFDIPTGSISHLQTFSDEEMEKRKKAHEEKMAKEQAQRPAIVQPAMRVPGRH